MGLTKKRTELFFSGAAAMLFGGVPNSDTFNISAKNVASSFIDSSRSFSTFRGALGDASKAMLDTVVVIFSPDFLQSFRSR